MFSAIEYDFIDLGPGFEPQSINENSQIVGVQKSSDPFLSEVENSAYWSEDKGIILLNTKSDECTAASDINEIGEIVGKASHTPLFLNVERPVFWSSLTSNWSQILYSEANPSTATGINNASMVTGYSVPRKSSYPHAFVWHKNTGVIDLHPSDEGMSKAYDINEEGQVVGEFSLDSSSSNKVFFAFQWTPFDGLQVLNTPGNYAAAFGNNDNGDIVGAYSSSEKSPKKAFLNKRDSSFQDLGNLGGSWSEAVAINSECEIVGSSEYIGKFQQGKAAFVWKAGKIKSLNKLVDRKAHWWLYEATDINDKGEIVGVAVNENDDSIKHGFLLKPKSKPLFQVDVDKSYKCIVLRIENGGKNPYPERKFISIPGDKVNELNDAGHVWCQPLDMIDLDREGEVKYEHNKLYEVILVYISGQTSKNFTSFDYLNKNRTKTELKNAKPGDKFLVPGYFLNDWNNRVHPVTGHVYFWFQPTEVLSKPTRVKMTQYAKTQKF